MMKYDDIVVIASEITNNELIKTDGLILVYELENDNHVKLDEDLFYRTNEEKDAKYEYSDIIDVTIGEVNFRFIKKDLEKSE